MRLHTKKKCFLFHDWELIGENLSFDKHFICQKCGYGKIKMLTGTILGWPETDVAWRRRKASAK